MGIPITWDLKVTGADQVRFKIIQLKDVFRDTGDLQQFAKGMREVSRESRALVAHTSVNKNLFRAMYPEIYKVSKAMNVFGSAMRSVMAISNTLNLLSIADSLEGQRAKTEIADVESNIALLEKRLEDMRKNDPGNLLGIAELENELQKARNQLALLQNDANAFKWDNVLTIASTIGTAIATGISTGIKILETAWGSKHLLPIASRAGALFGGIFVGFSSAIIGVGNWLSTALGTAANGGAIFPSASKAGTLWGTVFYGAVVAALITAIAGSFDVTLEKLFGFSPVKEARRLLGDKNPKSVGDELGINQQTFPIFGQTYDDWQKEAGMGRGGKDTNPLQSFMDLFKFGLPEAYGINEEALNTSLNDSIPTIVEESADSILSPWSALWDTVITIANQAGQGITDGLNSAFGGVISHMNSMISAYNAAADKIGKPKISKLSFSSASYQPIPGIAAANGFDGVVTRPTMFLAGEAGPESISITPTRSGSGGGGVTQIFHIHGSVLAERQLEQIAANGLKNRLKRSGRS